MQGFQWHASELVKGTGGDDDQDRDDKQETAVTVTTMNMIRVMTEQEREGNSMHLLSTDTLFIAIYVLL